MTVSTAQLAELFPTNTAGVLPSSRTEGMLQDALDSTDIDAVKAQLEHVWAHYQSLEFMLNSAADQPAAIYAALSGMAGDVGIAFDDLTPEQVVSATLAMVAAPLLRNAYHVAHSILPLLVEDENNPGTDVTVPDALRATYPQLDHTDPSAGYASELEKFLAELLDGAETTDKPADTE